MTSSSQINIEIPRFPRWLVGLALLFSVASAQETGHWALKELEKPKIPSGVNPVDWFIQSRLEEVGLAQNNAADRHALLRRATLDLTGLPPTREEISAFVEDSSPKAYAALVDRLLASPHYGERWGRHWLDVARYVQGSIKVPGIDRIDLAEPYRDYVVRSFNADKPYDRFIAEQLAGDLLESDSESREDYYDRITAPAFLSIGQWFEECTDPDKLRLDIVDEQISTSTRAFLAMDFACSRCHDHKFDPVPTRDYYALAGIFRSTEITEHFAEEWKDGRPRAIRPLAGTEYFERTAAIEKERQSLLRERFDILSRTRDERLGEPRAEAAESPLPVVAAFEAEDFAGHKNLKTVRLGSLEAVATRRRLDQWAKYRLDIPEPGNYTLLVRYAAREASPVELELNGETASDRVLGEPTFGESADHLRWDPLPLKDIEAGTLHVRFKVNRHEPFPVLEAFKLVAGEIDSEEPDWRLALGKPTLEETKFFLAGKATSRVSQIERSLAELGEKVPEAELTLAVSDTPAPIDLAVHANGDARSTIGDPVPRGTPSLAGHLIEDEFPVPPDESGRRQFAEWLIHPDHPLTARVMVNRIWHWHFGTGLVRTVDDFGLQGEAPSHPELLDWLAAEFIESGWSIKHVHRAIMLSETYRASSRKTPENTDLDPDGLLFSRFPARRLEVEAIYDSMLTSIGKVPRQAAGSDLDNSKSKDRALYILTSSRSPLGLGVEIRKMFPLFGFDPSGRPMHARDRSATSEQALWWLNNPLPGHYAEKLAERALEAHEDPARRVQFLHETTLGRPADSGVERAMLDYANAGLDDAGLSEKEAWTRVCLGLFSSKSFSRLE
ncbi:MAG: DUF1549 domain-containing protein [Verrucomicrobiales bacterium]